tara:strand:- start:322 stop:633 length:312 start_codon:yes stop_codon:yes gene_type:complete
MNKTIGNNMNIEFTGKSIVFTGASIIKRDYLFGLCEAIGAIPQKYMNKDTDILIVGEKPGSKKLGMANKYNIQQVEDHCFVDVINKTYPNMTPEEILDEYYDY